MSDSAKKQMRLLFVFEPALDADHDRLAELFTGRIEPLTQRILGHEHWQANFYFSGALLDYLVRHHEPWLLSLKEAVDAEQLAIIGGPFYGAAPSLVSSTDLAGQLEMSSEFWRSIVGDHVTGAWLAQSVWVPELPVLLRDTDCDFSFIARSQVDHDGPFISERGGDRLYLFTTEQAPISAEPNTWLRESVEQRGADMVRVFCPLTKHDAYTDEALAAWDQIPQTVAELGFELTRCQKLEQTPTTPWPQANPKPVEWLNVVTSSPGDVLYRRMQQLSERLQESIEEMEEDELEDQWSDQLATAQRHLFSAQDCRFYIKHNTDAMMTFGWARLIEAAEMIDSLGQDGDWISLDQEDRDADGLTETLVSTSRQQVWVAPGLGGAIKSLEIRKRRQAIVNLRSSLKTGASFDEAAIAWQVVDGQTHSSEWLNGSSISLLDKLPPWQTTEDDIDAEGDCHYHYRGSLEAPLEGFSPRTLRLGSHTAVMIDESAISWEMACELEGDPQAMVLLSMPLYFARGIKKVLVNDERAPDDAELFEVKSLKFVDQDGLSISLTFSNPANLWWSGGHSPFYLRLGILWSGSDNSPHKLTLSFDD